MQSKQKISKHYCKLEIGNEKVLMILGEKNDNVYLSSRNLKKVKVVTADSVNTFDVLNAKK